MSSASDLTDLTIVQGRDGLRAKAFTAADPSRLNAVYARLAAQLGHKHVKQEITASFAGGGLVLLLLGSVMSLRWFGRLV